MLVKPINSLAPHPIQFIPFRAVALFIDHPLLSLIATPPWQIVLGGGFVVLHVVMVPIMVAERIQSAVVSLLASKKPNASNRDTTHFNVLHDGLLIIQTIHLKTSTRWTPQATTNHIILARRVVTMATIETSVIILRVASIVTTTTTTTTTKKIMPPKLVVSPRKRGKRLRPH